MFDQKHKMKKPVTAPVVPQQKISPPKKAGTDDIEAALKAADDLRRDEAANPPRKQDQDQDLRISRCGCFGG